MEITFPGHRFTQDVLRHSRARLDRCDKALIFDLWECPGRIRCTYPMTCWCRIEKEIAKRTADAEVLRLIENSLVPEPQPPVGNPNEDADACQSPVTVTLVKLSRHNQPGEDYRESACFQCLR